MVIHQIDSNIKGTSIDYRPDIKVLDCTVRDGSLINDAKFEMSFVHAVYHACAAAGVDYMEIGYKTDRRIAQGKEFGPWKYCSEDDMRKAIGEKNPNLKISVMADTGRTNYHTDILPREQSVVDMVRVACYVHQIPAAIDMIKDAHDKGYETSLNLMAISTAQDREITEALEAIVKSPADVIYLVDSYGSLYFQPIRDLALTYLKSVEGTGKQIGIHAHNNMQLAFANTIESLALGVSFADATINGIGRGPGNCPLEILLSFLKNPKFKVRPILECIQNEVEPLRGKMQWGWQIPYLITGMNNEHPRAAIEFVESTGPKNLVDFYDKMIDN